MKPIPRPEHPMPQWKRAHWKNLNGSWQFRAYSEFRQKLNPNQVSFEESIMVPFCPESRLSGIGRGDFMKEVWYRRTFCCRPGADTRTILHFGAADWQADVWVNGKKAGTHKGGYTAFAFDITALLLSKGANEVCVRVRDDTQSRLQPTGKQADHEKPEGCFYTRVTGLWQTVWLEYVPKNHLRNAEIAADAETGKVFVTGRAQGEGAVKAQITYAGRSVACGEGKAENGIYRIDVTIPQPKLWEPGRGRLYHVKLSFAQDAVTTYFAFRTVSIRGNRFLINGKPVFQRLVLDQGYNPDGIYTAPSEKAYRREILLAREAGFNGLRLHQKVFEPRFLSECDRAGMLVWGEYASWGIDVSDAAALGRLKREWLEAVQDMRAHPAVILWCPLNETWDCDGRRQNDARIAEIYHATKRADSSRPCIDASGFFHVETDVYDVHDYEQDPDAFAAVYAHPLRPGVINDQAERTPAIKGRQQYGGQPFLVSEFGGMRFGPEQGGWGYGDALETAEDAAARYRALVRPLLENPDVCGFCYTQLFDVEQEKNGLYTENRLPKLDMGAVRAVNRQKAAYEKQLTAEKERTNV